MSLKKCIYKPQIWKNTWNICKIFIWQRTGIQKILRSPQLKNKKINNIVINEQNMLIDVSQIKHTRLGNEHMKKVCNVISYHEKQSNITMRNHYIWPKWLKWKRLTTLTLGKIVEKLELFWVVGGNLNCYHYFRKYLCLL